MALSARATMDFFQGQAQARRRTALLVFLFFLAVLFTIVGLYFAAVISLIVYGSELYGWWHPGIFFNVTASVGIVVMTGSLYKIIDLMRGGSRVAESLGGVLVDRNTGDRDERRLLNVVEEMAIASGVPAPRVYLLPEERGINAFAAGYEPHNAVVAVTRGSLSTLSRDELQGVIAHEFSHILNGDMRLNMKLMGIINGILCLAMIGRVILRSKGRSSDRGKGAGAIYLFAFFLLLIGYIGVFFGKLIKSAVSRQREFLADAAAVQFTRNPSGIGGALRKIASLEGGSMISNPHAEEASHFFFVSALPGFFARLFSTHPPLGERIKRIDTALLEPVAVPEPSERPIPESRPIAPSLFSETGSDASSGTLRLEPKQFTDSVGTLQAVHVEHVQRLVAGLPSPIIEATRNPLGAKALVYCLLLCQDGKSGERAQSGQWGIDPAAEQEIARIGPLIFRLGREHRLPLADMAWPALMHLSPLQYREFRGNVRQLIEADRRVDLFEFALSSLLMNRLDAFFGMAKPRKIRYRFFDQVRMECFELMSILARQGCKNETDAQRAFEKAIHTLGSGGSLSILAAEKCTMELLERTLTRLAETSFDLRKRILSACLLCVSADNRITVQEAELLRAIAENLDCPVPPLIATEVPAAA